MTIKQFREARASLPKGLRLAFCPTGPGGGVDNSCSSKSAAKDVDAAALISKSHKHLGELIGKLARDGGFTYNPRYGTFPKAGYAVSPYKQAEKVFSGDKVATVPDFESYINEHLDLLTQSGTHLGGWYNPDDSKVYLDISVVSPDKETAMELARQNNQLAIFDLGKLETITL